MASTPTTKSQVQAYRFVLKRMESALVRRDAVMLHDPMRTHLRAGIVGLCLALVAVAGVFIYGFFKPRDALGGNDQIVLGSDSGSMFVLVHNPTRRLIPVTNLASARLIMVRQAAGGGAPGTVTAAPKRVKDDVLKDIPREPLAGIPGAPVDIPGGGELVDPKWALCDTTEQEPSLPEQKRILTPTITTTALVGVEPDAAPELQPQEALLFRSNTSEYFLVFDGKRAKVDVTDGAVRQAFSIVDVAGGVMRDERRVSTGLLNAIPEAPALVSPISELGRPSTFPELDGQPTGTVAEVIEVDNRRTYYAVLDDGIQQVPKSLAQLIRYTVSNDAEFFPVRPEDITRIPKVSSIDTSGFPTEVPSIMPVSETRVACVQWAFVENEQRTRITTSNQLRLSGDQRPVKLAQADGSGERLDEVFLPTGRGAAVRGVVPDQPPGTGTIFLVTDTGVKFGVPAWGELTADKLAESLGLNDIRPAPEAILRLLPIGPALDPDQAVRTFDSVPVPDGAGASLPAPDAQFVPQAPVEEPEVPIDPFNPVPPGDEGG